VAIYGKPADGGDTSCGPCGIRMKTARDSQRRRAGPDAFLDDQDDSELMRRAADHDFLPSCQRQAAASFNPDEELPHSCGSQKEASAQGSPKANGGGLAAPHVSGFLIVSSFFSPSLFFRRPVEHGYGPAPPMGDGVRRHG